MKIKELEQKYRSLEMEKRDLYQQAEDILIDKIKVYTPHNEDNVLIDRLRQARNLEYPVVLMGNYVYSVQKECGKIEVMVCESMGDFLNKDWNDFIVINSERGWVDKLNCFNILNALYEYLERNGR